MAGSTLRITFLPLTGPLKRSFREAGDESVRLGHQLERVARSSLDVRDAALRAESAQGRAARAAERYGRDSLQAARANVALERQQERLTAAVNRATGAEERLAAAERRTAAARSSAASALRNLTSRVAVGSALAATFAAGSTIKQTVEYDRALRNVNSIAQLSDRSLGRLGASVRDLGGRTAQAPVTLAEGLYDLVSSGFDASQSLRILRSTSKAATAGLTDTATSTKVTAAVLNAYHLRARDAAHVSDTLFRTVDRGVISYGELAQSFGEVLPWGNALGVSIGELGAATATLTKNGEQPPEAMTKIKGAMVALLKPTRDMSAAYDELGVRSGRELIEQTGSLQGALQALEKTTDGNQQKFQKLFPDIRGAAGAMQLSGRNARAANADLRGFADVSGSTARALAQQSRSVSYQWDKLKASASGLAIGVGQELVPEMTQLLEVGGDVTREFFAGLTGRPLRGSVSDAREFGSAVRDIAGTVGPIVGDVAEISRETAGFVAHNDELRQLVALLIAGGAAAKAIRFTGAITGVNQLVTGYGRLSRAQRAAGLGPVPAGGTSVMPMLGGRRAWGPDMTGPWTLGRAYKSYGMQRALGAGRYGAFSTATRGYMRRPLIMAPGGGGVAAGLGLAFGGSLVGDAVGGRGGSILGGAAQGAGLGMLAGPWGAAIGGLVGGIGTAIVDGLRGRAKDEAERAARDAAADLRRRTESALASGFSRTGARNLAARSARAARASGDVLEHQRRAADLQREIDDIRSRRLGLRGQMRIDDLSGELERELEEIRRLTPRARSAAAAVISGLKANWRGFRFLDARSMVRDFVVETRGLTPELKAQAAESMLEWARQMERSGKLPRGSVRRIAAGISSEIRVLGPLLGRVTEQSVDDGIDERRVTRRIRSVVAAAGRAFQGLPVELARQARSLPAATAALKGSIEELESRAAQLRRQAQSGTAQQRAQASRQLAAVERALDGMRRVYRQALGEIDSRYGTSGRAADRWMERTGRAIRQATDQGRARIDSLTSALGRLELALQGVDTSVPTPAILNPPLVPGRPQRRRAGGLIRRFQQGGLVPAFVSPGEEVEYGGRSWMVPGTRVARDNVFTWLPEGSRVWTEHGQHLRAAGVPDDVALAAQAPHFAKGGVVRGRVSTFGPPLERAGTMASGKSSSVAGLALNLQPGTDSGWNNPTTQGWIAAARRGQAVNFTVQIGARRGVLPLLDLGPAGSTGRAIDVTGAGARRLGIDPARFPTDSIGTARPVGKGNGFAFMRQPSVLRPRLVDILQPYGALDAFDQGFQSALEQRRTIWRTPTGLDSDLFRSATSGVRPNARDLPRRLRVSAASGGRGPSGSPGTWRPGINTLAWGRSFASRFGMSISSTYRSPSHNASVNGVPNSKHTHGSPANPGAIDFVPPKRAALVYARSHGAREALIHDAGSGMHLHLGFFRRGGVVSFRGGGSAGSRPRTVPGLISGIRGWSTRGGAGEVVGMMRLLADAIDDVERVSYRRLERLDRGVREEIRDLARGGLTGRERVQVRRLRGTLTLLEGEMGRRVGLLASSAQRMVDIVGRQQASVSRRLALRGIDEGSAQGLGALLESADGTLGLLHRALADVRRALRRARRARDPAAVRALQDEADQILGQIADTRVQRAEYERELEHARRYDPLNAQLALAQLSGDRAAQLGSLGQIEQELLKDLEDAKRRNDYQAIQDLAGQLQSVQGSIRELRDAIADQEQAMREHTEALNEVTRQLKLQNELAQAIGGVSTGEAMRALADVISGQIAGHGYAPRSQSPGDGTLSRY